MLYSEAWPRAGMTRNGTAYQLRPLAPLSVVTGSGLWPTLTTQDAANNGGPSQHQRNSLPLNALVQHLGWLPTLRAGCEKGTAGPDFAREDREGSGGDDLVTVLARMARTNPRRREAASRQPSLLGDRHSPRSAQEAITGLLLNPYFAEWFMGFPLGWTALTPSAIQLFPKRPSGLRGGSASLKAGSGT